MMRGRLIYDNTLSPLVAAYFRGGCPCFMHLQHLLAYGLKFPMFSLKWGNVQVALPPSTKEYFAK